MTTEKKLNMAELTQVVNEELKKNSSEVTDARMSSELSERRVRDYITKGLLDKPFGQGRDKWFGMEHVNKLVALRKLQSDGLSDQQLKKFSTSSSAIYGYDTGNVTLNATQTLGVESFSEQESLKSDALNFLASLPSAQNAVASSSLLNKTISASTPVLEHYYQTTPEVNAKALTSVKKQINKVWNEYQLDDEGKVFLKMESNAKITNPELVLEQIKSIIGGKND